MDFVLRKWVPEDAESVAHYADNPRIARNLRDTFPCPYTLRDAESYIASVMEGEDRQLCRAIVVAGAAAGGIGVFPGSDVYRKSAEIGYWLAEEYWNQGIMTSAVRQICKEAFKKLDIVRIYAEPYVYNAGSRAVLQTTGFVLEGVMKKGVFKDGRFYDYCMYALLKPQADYERPGE